MKQVPYVPQKGFVHRCVDALPEPLPGVVKFTGCLAFLVVGIFLIPFIPLATWLRRRRQRWFIEHLRSQRRIISWQQLIEKTSRLNGSVVIEIGNKAETRFWWTEAQVLSLAPTPPTPFKDINFIVYGDEKYTQFARWCYEQYLSPIDGTAALAIPVEPDFSNFPDSETWDEDMRKRFPNQQVAIVAFYDARYI